VSAINSDKEKWRGRGASGRPEKGAKRRRVIQGAGPPNGREAGEGEQKKARKNVQREKGSCLLCPLKGRRLRREERIE